MDKEYFNSNLNATLARWISPGPALARDCGACAKALKCCDFQPFVPNFLLGGWLESMPEFSRPNQVFLAPIGAIPTLDYRRKYSGGVKEACGFFADGRCSLWRYRPGECSTYFCEAERPVERDSSFAVELAVAQMALVEQGFSADEISAQIDLVNGVREREYSVPEMRIMYKKAWNWSQTLQPETVRAWI